MGCVGINIYNTHVYTHLQNTVCYVSNDTDGKRFTQKGNRRVHYRGGPLTAVGPRGTSEKHRLPEPPPVEVERE